MMLQLRAATLRRTYIVTVTVSIS